MSDITPLRTVAERTAYRMVADRPGTLEYRRDFDGQHYWYRDGQTAIKSRARTLDALVKSGRIVLRKRMIRTVGLREQREALVAYPVRPA